MICLDTNIIIAFSKGKLNLKLLDGLEVIHSPIVRIEALGFEGILLAEDRFTRGLLAMTADVSLSTAIVERAIEIRQTVRIDTPDAIIAATAMAFDAELWSANTRDFKDIEGLKLHNPMKRVS